MLSGLCSICLLYTSLLCLTGLCRHEPIRELPITWLAHCDSIRLVQAGNGEQMFVAAITIPSGLLCSLVASLMLFFGRLESLPVYLVWTCVLLRWLPSRISPSFGWSGYCHCSIPCLQSAGLALPFLQSARCPARCVAGSSHQVYVIPAHQKFNIDPCPNCWLE